MRTGWLGTLAATALVTVACGSISATPPSASGPAIRNLALVTLSGSNDIVVRDITDIDHPMTVSTLGQISMPMFVSGTELSYLDGSGLVRTPLSGSPKTVVSSQITGVFAWSPDGSAVVYATQSNSGTGLHQLNAGEDRLLGSTPGEGIGGCESIEGCAIANSLDFRLSYSPDGTSISLVSSGFGVSAFRLWSSDGKLVKTSDSQGETMSAWSGKSLYFRDSSGVKVWRDGTVSSFLPGVAWIKPKASPGGGQIVYSARDSDGWAHTYVVDTTTRNVREIKVGRSGAVFLTSRYIWYQGERACAPADGCGLQPPFHPLSGKTYIYDLQNGIETESDITAVFDVWPHPA